MDILKNNIYNNVNGFIISENTYLNKGKIFRVYTDKFGLISIYSKNTEMYLSMYSNYNFNLTYGNEFFYCNEYEMVEFVSFKSKEHILFLNILTEIILKTNVQELKNLEVYNLITDILNVEKVDYKMILTYFSIKYLAFNGYHILFENIKNFEKFNFDISELVINSNSIFNYKYNYILNKYEYNYIYFLYNLESFENFDSSKFEVNYSRILGIMLNALCLNFNIYKLNSFNLR